MQVAVAGVEHVRAAQPVLLRPSRRSRAAPAPSARARNRAVHAVVVGRDAARPRETPPCGRTRSSRRSRLVSRHADLGGARRRAARADLAPSPPRPPRGVPSDSTQQHRRRVERSSRRARTPRPRASPAWSIISRPAGMMPAPMIAATAAPAFSTSSNAASAHLRASAASAASLTVISVMTASSPSRAGDEREQVVAGRCRARRRRTRRRSPVIVHAAHAAHVVHGEPVLEAMHAARVLGDVAADRAGDLRRRIGRVVEAVAAPRPRRSRDCARPAARRAVRATGSIARMRLNLASDEHDAVARRAARRRRGSCPRRARPPARRARGRSRGSQRTCASFSGSATAAGSCAVRGEAVALVGPRVLHLVEHAFGRQAGAQGRAPPPPGG